MTDTDRQLDAISAAAAELVPALSERLRRHGLGEIEVASAELRLRVTASPDGGVPAAAADHATRAPEPTPRDSPQSGPSHVEVPSPAVGFFVYADGLGPGLEVAKGDAVGHV